MHWNGIEEFNARLQWRSMKQTHLTCHPKAMRAWSCWRDLDRQFDLLSMLSVAAIASLQSVDPIHVRRSLTRTGRGEFEFFGGFSSVELVMRAGLERAIFCVHTSASDELVRNIAEASSLKPLSYGLDYATGLHSLSASVTAHYEKSRVKQLFLGRNLSYRNLAEIAGVPLSKVRGKSQSVSAQLRSKETILQSIVKSETQHD